MIARRPICVLMPYRVAQAMRLDPRRVVIESWTALVLRDVLRDVLRTAGLLR